MPETAIQGQNSKSAEQFEDVVKLLEDSRAELERVLAGLTDEFCLRKPPAGGWSITEVVEHLVMIERRIPRLLQMELPKQELASDTSDIRRKDAELVDRMGSDTAKMDAPGFVKPAGRYASCRQALEDFNAARQNTLAYTLSTPPYLCGRLLPHPLLGPIDGYQWLLILGPHTQRHIKQITGIKAAQQHEVTLPN